MKKVEVCFHASLLFKMNFPYKIFILNYLNFSDSYLIYISVIVGIPSFKLSNIYNFLKFKAFFESAIPEAETWNDLKQTLRWRRGTKPQQNHDDVISKGRQVVWTVLMWNCRTVLKRSSAVAMQEKTTLQVLLYRRLVGFVSDVPQRLCMSEHAPCGGWKCRKTEIVLQCSSGLP